MFVLWKPDNRGGGSAMQDGAGVVPLRVEVPVLVRDGFTFFFCAGVLGWVCRKDLMTVERGGWRCVFLLLEPMLGQVLEMLHGTAPDLPSISRTVCEGCRRGAGACEENVEAAKKMTTDPCRPRNVESVIATNTQRATHTCCHGPPGGRSSRGILHRIPETNPPTPTTTQSPPPAPPPTSTTVVFSLASAAADAAAAATSRVNPHGTCTRTDCETTGTPGIAISV